MRIEDIEVKKGGNVTINSIFEFGSSLDVTMLIDKCRRTGCVLRFENEDITIDDSYSNDTAKMATVTLYTLLMVHPKAAQDYFNYLFDQANKKHAPGK